VDQNPEVPFETLRYVIAEINYGGRVTDRIDIRLIVGVLKKYMHKEIMKNDFPYSADGVYYNPEALELDQIKETIAKLPLEDDTDIFGMHSNALITFQ
jgi:dynein heavy chain